MRDKKSILTAAFLKMDSHNKMLLVLTLVVFIIMTLTKPNIFPTWYNFNSMLLQISDVGLLSIGIMLAFLIGGIDLSIVSNAVLSATLAGMVIHRLEPLGAGIAITFGVITAVFVGMLGGFINGILITKVALPAILTTLGTNILFRGIAVGITNGSTLSGFPDQFVSIGNDKILGVYYPFLILLCVALAVHVYLTRTSSGAKAYLLGSNAKASFFSGINNVKVAVIVYTMIGLIAALSGLIMMSRSNSINPDYGTSYLLQIILVCVVGGVNINGGYGKTSGILLSLLLLQCISTSLNMLLSNYPGASFFKNFAWGFLLLMIMVLKTYDWREMRNRYGRLGKGVESK